jgi:hypothetical protein
MNLQPVRLSFQPLIFSLPAGFFSHINQSSILLVAYFQPKRTSCSSLALGGESKDKLFNVLGIEKVVR